MKHRSLIILLVALILGSTHSYAGLAIRKPSTQIDSTVSNAGTGYYYSREQRLDAVQKLANAVPLLHNERPRDTSGWEGIVALCCGILAIVTFGITAIPAIIFGALGLGRGKKNQGLAIAGLVLGILTIVLIVLFALIISSFYL